MDFQNCESNQNTAKNSESAKTLEKLLSYLHSNISSSYPKADYVMRFLDSKVDSSVSDEVDDDYTQIIVKDNESLVKLLVGFLANPSEKYYRVMRSKLSKAKNIDFPDLLVPKRVGESVEVNLSSKLSVNDLLTITSQSYQNDYYPDFSRMKNSKVHFVKLYVQRDDVTSAYLDSSSTPKEFANEFKVPVGRNEDTDTPLYIELEDFLSSFNVDLEVADERELPVSVHYSDLQTLLYYLPSTNGRVSVPLYTSTDLSYVRNDTHKFPKKYVSLSHLLEKVEEMSGSDGDFIKLHVLVKKLRTELHGKKGNYVSLDDLHSELDGRFDVKPEPSSEKKKRDRRVREHNDKLDFDEEDNYWNLDLTSKAVQKKIARLQEGRNWKDSWSESLLYSMNDESGAANESDLELLSVGTLQKILNGEEIVKYEYVPFKEFHKRLDLLVRDLTDGNMDHFARNCRKLVNLLVELDNRDLVKKVILMKEQNSKDATIKLARMEANIVRSLQYLCDSGNNDDIKDVLKSAIETLSQSARKRLSAV